MLSQFVQWEQALLALGLEPASSVTLPATTKCIFCQGKLVIFADIRGGAWARCADCRWAGDLIELAMKHWQLDLLSALRKLESRGVSFPEWVLTRLATSRYEEEVLDYRANIQKFWAKAKLYPFQDNVEIARLHDQFGLNSTLDTERWYSQVGQLVGGGSVIEAIAAIKRVDNTIPTLPSVAETFRGGDWHEVLVIPSYDMPGRICGFWFCGRRGRYPKDWAYAWVERQKFKLGSVTSPLDERECGLAFFDPAHIFHKQFKTTMFVFNNPDIALRLHGRHFRDHGEYLPVVLAYDGSEGRTQMIFSSLEQRDWVFWSGHPEKEIFAQAQAADGRVAIFPSNIHDEIRHHMTWLKRIRSEALPWRDALAGQLTKLTDAQLEAILMHCDLQAEDSWQAFLARCPAESHQRLRACHNRKWPTPTLRVGWSDIAKRPCGFVSETTGEILSDVLLEVTHAFKKKSKSKVYAYYRVKCNYGDHEWSVSGSNRDLRTHLPAMIEEYMITHDIGVPRFSSNWKYGLFDIVLKFSNPQLITINPKRLSHRGWDDKD